MIVFTFLIKGFIIGFIAAAPVGPFGLMGLKRTMANGRISGILSGGGIATGFAIWVFILLNSLTFITGLIIKEAYWLQLFGGVFLLLFGLHSFTFKPKTPALKQKANSRLREFWLTFIPVITSPATFITFTVLFTVIQVSHPNGALPLSLYFSFTVFLGALFLWFIIGHLLEWGRYRLTERHFVMMNRITSFLIVTFSCYLLFNLLLF